MKNKNVIIKIFGGFILRLFYPRKKSKPDTFKQNSKPPEIPRTWGHGVIWLHTVIYTYFYWRMIQAVDHQRHNILFYKVSIS